MMTLDTEPETEIHEGDFVLAHPATATRQLVGEVIAVLRGKSRTTKFHDPEYRVRLYDRTGPKDGVLSCGRADITLHPEGRQSVVDEPSDAALKHR